MFEKKIKKLGMEDDKSDLPVDLKAKKNVVQSLRKMAMDMMGDDLAKSHGEEEQDGQAVVAKLDIAKTNPAESLKSDDDTQDLGMQLEHSDDLGEPGIEIESEEECNTPESIDAKIFELLEKKKQLSAVKPV